MTSTVRSFSLDYLIHSFVESFFKHQNQKDYLFILSEIQKKTQFSYKLNLLIFSRVHFSAFQVLNNRTLPRKMSI